MQQGAQVPLVSSKVEPLEQLINPSMNNNARKRGFEVNSPEDTSGNDKPDDEKLAKKQRRLVKNREAAAQFRHRQKAYMQKLEKHAEELTQSNIQVTAKIELLDTENKLMKEQLTYLRNFMKQAVALSFPNSLPSLPPDSGAPESTTQPIIPDLFPDDTLPPSNMASPPLIKTEPFIVPDITNPSSLPSSPPTVPTSIPASASVTPITPNPSLFVAPIPTTISSSPSSSSTVPTTSPPPSPLPIPLLPPSTPTPPSSTSSTPTTPTHPTTNATSSPSLITSTNLLTDPFLSGMSNNSGLSASSTLGSSSTLSSIFNSILGTDLSFSGVLVKTEPSDSNNNINNNNNNSHPPQG